MLNWSKDNRNSEDWVVALGSVWRFLHGRRLVVCLRRGDAERDAALHWFEVDWNDFWRFAAVRKSLDTSKTEISWEPRILSLEKKMEKLTEK
jgi:hypothetical protein